MLHTISCTISAITNYRTVKVNHFSSDWSIVMVDHFSTGLKMVVKYCFRIGSTFIEERHFETSLEIIVVPQITIIASADTANS